MVFYVSMRAAYQVIEPPAGNSLRCWRGIGESFNAPWHFHPEIEINFVERSRGLRFIGDSVEPFAEGDLVLVGANLPHQWVNTNVPPHPPVDYAIGTCVQFRQDFAGGDLWALPEFAAVLTLFGRGARGLHFTGATVQSAVTYIERIVAATGAERITELLLLLDLLAKCRSSRELSSAGFVPALNHTDAARINAACRYVQENLTGEISQCAAANLVRMSSSTFSGFFRKKVGRTFSAYVTELRLARAIHFMLEKNMSVSEAAFASGFNNLSNFNHHFRVLKGMCPRTYLNHCNANSQEIETSFILVSDRPQELGLGLFRNDQGY